MKNILNRNDLGDELNDLKHETDVNLHYLYKQTCLIYDENPEDEVWYIHSPLKKGNRELVTAPPPSQIPYLNGVFDDEATMNQPKAIYFRETDTDYIRRCKLGTTDNLLVHVDPATRKSKEPVAYPRPLWWDAMCEQIPEPTNPGDNQGKKTTKSEHVFGAPDWFAHTEHKRSPDKSKQ